MCMIVCIWYDVIWSFDIILCNGPHSEDCTNKIFSNLPSEKQTKNLHPRNLTYPPWNQHSTWKWMVGRLISFWAIFRGKMAVSFQGSVPKMAHHFKPHRKDTSIFPRYQQAKSSNTTFSCNWLHFPGNDSGGCSSKSIRGRVEVGWGRSGGCEEGCFFFWGAETVFFYLNKDGFFCIFLIFVCFDDWFFFETLFFQI